jgi:hypothetical protein
MLRWRNQQSSNQRRSNWSTCLSLLTRIRNQRRLDAWIEIIRVIRKRSLDLFIYLIILIIFQCPNRVYNAWKGPFSINQNEFRNRLEMNSNLIDLKSFFPFDWGFFYSEYIQIELGENIIDQSKKNTLRVFYGHYSHGKLLYTYNRVQKLSIDKPKMTLYVKFASQDQSYSQKRYLYRFQSFSTHTLKCILEQLSISSREYLHWPEKSMYIKKIEEIYDKNPILFNKKVIKTCGILIGYLYRPRNEYVFPGDSYEYYYFTKNVRVFDASSSYTPYISYILVGLFIYFIFKCVVDLVQDISSWINSASSIVHSSIEKQIRTSNLNSLENLDNILLNTTDENNHHDRLFIVHEKYVVMLMIDLREENKEILRRFYENAPLIIIPIDMIKTVRESCIILKNNNSNPWIEFPMRSFKNNFNPEHWLHQRLMIINDEYRLKYVMSQKEFSNFDYFSSWEREEQLRHLEETRLAREEELRRLLLLFTEEETQYQQRHYGNDRDRIVQRITSASPRFIAEFRLSDRQRIPEDLVDTICTICLEDFQLDSCYAEWPCTAKHIFHFDCMLGVLRTKNTCPLCRFPVEPANLPNIETVLRLLFGRMIPNIFN